jgi:hypothetical protein
MDEEIKEDNWLLNMLRNRYFRTYKWEDLGKPIYKLIVEHNKSTGKFSDILLQAWLYNKKTNLDKKYISVTFSFRLTQLGISADQMKFYALILEEQ